MNLEEGSEEEGEEQPLWVEPHHPISVDEETD
jgi:hypothetical protein